MNDLPSFFGNLFGVEFDPNSDPNLKLLGLKQSKHLV